MNVYHLSLGTDFVYLLKKAEGFLLLVA